MNISMDIIAGLLLLWILLQHSKVLMSIDLLGDLLLDPIRVFIKWKKRSKRSHFTLTMQCLALWQVLPLLILCILVLDLKLQPFSSSKPYSQSFTLKQSITLSTTDLEESNCLMEIMRR